MKKYNVQIRLDDESLKKLEQAANYLMRTVPNLAAYIIKSEVDKYLPVVDENSQ